MANAKTVLNSKLNFVKFLIINLYLCPQKSTFKSLNKISLKVELKLDIHNTLCEKHIF